MTCVRVCRKNTRNDFIFCYMNGNVFLCLLDFPNNAALKVYIVSNFFMYVLYGGCGGEGS